MQCSNTLEKLVCLFNRLHRQRALLANVQTLPIRTNVITINNEAKFVPFQSGKVALEPLLRISCGRHLTVLLVT